MSTERHLLHEVFEAVAATMRADFDRSALTTHRASKGSAREESVREFLADYLPHVVEVTGSAEVIATDGQVSGQCDVTVVDASTPRLWSFDAIRTVPIESCYATVEVKSDLKTDGLQDAWRAAAKVKSMPRTAYLPLMGLFDLAGKDGTLDSMSPKCHLFAYSGVSLDTVREALFGLASEDPYTSLGLDSVCVLDQGFITWRSPSGEEFGDRQPGWDVVSCAADPGDVLLFLVTMLHRELANAELRPRLDLLKYVTRRLGRGASS